MWVASSLSHPRSDVPQGSAHGGQSHQLNPHPTPGPTLEPPADARRETPVKKKENVHSCWQSWHSAGMEPTSIPRDAKITPGHSRDRGRIWSRDPSVIPSWWKHCGKAGHEPGSAPWEKPKPLRAANSSCPAPGLLAGRPRGGLAPLQPFPSQMRLDVTAAYLIPKAESSLQRGQKKSQIPGKWPEPQPPPAPQHG